MTQLDPRILNRVAGYWPGYRMTPQAIAAWTHKLAAVEPDRVLAALDEFSNEDLPTPPRAGQLAARINPHTKADKTESELDRVRRQKARATECVKAGTMTPKDFDFYDKDFWQPTIDQHTKAA